MRNIKVWIIVGSVLLLGGIIIAVWQAHNQNKQADKDVQQSHTIDSLHTVQGQASARVDTVVDTLRIREDHYIKVAVNLGRVADTAGQHSYTIADSSAMWHLRFQLKGMQVDTLTVALSNAEQRADSLFADRNRWHLVADSAVSTMDALRKDLAVARSGCKVIPFVPCLSRKQTLIVGLVGGAVAYNRFHK